VRWPAKHTGSRRRTGTTRGTRTGDASYSFDALDRTAQETEHHPAANLTRTTTFTYEGLTSLVTKEVQQNTGGTTSTDTKTYNYDTYGHRISLNDTLVSGGTTTPTSYTYGYDVHGDVSLLVDQSNGSVKASYGYTPYGDSDTTLSKGDTNVNAPFNPYRYTGKRYDSGSQTLDMGARRFDTSAQRFLQMDQYQGALAYLGLSSDPLTQNRYGLAASNPLNAVEYGGHRPACLDQGSCTFTPSPNGSGSGTSHSTMGPTIAVRPDPGDVSMFFKLIAHGYTDDLAALESCSVLDRNDCYSSPEMQAAYNAATEQWLTMIASGQLVENSKCNCYTLGRHGLPALQYDIAEGGALVIIPILGREGRVGGGKGKGTGGSAAETLAGSGPVLRVLEASGRVKSFGALRNFYPKGGAEYLFDPETGTFAVGRPAASAGLEGSTHEQLAESIGG
jgi:RHS repeat-associated protein